MTPLSELTDADPRALTRVQLERFAADAIFGYGSLVLKHKFLAELRSRDHAPRN